MSEVINQLRIEVTDAPTEADRRIVVNGLEAYNDMHVAPFERQELALFLRDGQSTIQGGLLGSIWWRWVHVEVLWIAEAFRGQGHGTRLLERAEEIGRARGCRFSMLDTAEFQAKPFYEKYGYRVYGVLDELPPNSRNYYLFKNLMVGDETGFPGGITSLLGEGSEMKAEAN